VVQMLSLYTIKANQTSKCIVKLDNSQKSINFGENSIETHIGNINLRKQF